MIYKFTLISDEVDNFKREIQIDPDAKFLDLHQAILKSVKYKPIEAASFIICDDDWEPREEVNLSDVDDNPEVDVWLMDSTPITEFVEDEKQRLVYMYDVTDQRSFYLELTEIIIGKSIKNPKCTNSIGEAPEQFIAKETVVTKQKAIDIDESFYGDTDYDKLEIEGFENLEDL